MPKNCIKFISGFLIPSLDNKRFGEHLKWISKSKKMFQIDWHHRGGSSWTEQEAEVFIEWDKNKGHFQPDEKSYHAKSKQRFRSLLYKLSQDGHLKSLPCDDKYKKLYCIVKKKNYKRRCNEINSEYEQFNEGVSLFDDEEDDVHLDSTYRRKISEDDVINALEDHTYSSATILQNKNTDCERNKEVQDHSDELDCLEKRVLVEKNNMHIEHFQDLKRLTQNINDTQLPEDFLMNEDLKVENINRSKSSENLQNDPCFTPVYKIYEENAIFTEADFIQSCGLYMPDLMDMP